MEVDMNFCRATGLPLPSRPPPASSDWGDWRCLCCEPQVAYCQDCGAPIDAAGDCAAYRAQNGPRVAL